VSRERSQHNRCIKKCIRGNDGIVRERSRTTIPCQPCKLTCLTRHRRTMIQGHRDPGVTDARKILRNTHDRCCNGLAEHAAKHGWTETTHLLLSAFARITGLSCALTLVVGYFRPRHDGLEGVVLRGRSAIRMPRRPQSEIGIEGGRCCGGRCDPTGLGMLHDTEALTDKGIRLRQ
jgi:hypothetical protein